MGLVVTEDTLSLMKNNLPLSKSQLNYPLPPAHNALVANIIHCVNINSSTDLCTTECQELNTP